MGFLQFIPATTITATYEPRTKTLYLYAQGDSQKYTSGVAFHRDPRFVGGLKFNLMGWVGPLGQGTEPYAARTSFTIGEEPKQVVIEDASGSHVIEVRSLGADVALSPEASPAPSSDKMKVLFKLPFELQQPSSVPLGGSVSIAFDPKYLVLESAGIQSRPGSAEEIVWTFNSLQTGNTQVTITVSGGIAAFVMRRVVDVEIFVLASGK